MSIQDQCFVSKEKAKQVANYLSKHPQKVKSAKGINAFLSLFAEASGFTGHQKTKDFLNSLSGVEAQGASIEVAPLEMSEDQVDFVFSYWVSYFVDDKKKLVNSELIEKFPEFTSPNEDMVGNILSILECASCEDVLKQCETLDSCGFARLRDIYKQYFLPVFGAHKADLAFTSAFGEGKWVDIIFEDDRFFKVTLYKCDMSSGESFDSFQVVVKAGSEEGAHNLAFALVNRYVNYSSSTEFQVGKIEDIGGIERYCEILGADTRMEWVGIAIKGVAECVYEGEDLDGLFERGISPVSFNQRLKDLPVPEEEIFSNHYVCNYCQNIWEVEGCDSMHNDKCEDCRREYTPYMSVLESTGAVAEGCELLSFSAEFYDRSEGRVTQKDCVWLPETLFLVDGDQYLLKSSQGAREDLKRWVSEMWQELAFENMENWSLVSHSDAELCVASKSLDKKVCLNRLYD